MKRLFIPTLMIWTLLPGCVQWSANKQALIEQASRVVDVTAQSIESRSRQAQAAFDARRKQLDDAFDLDVQQRSQLDAQWVIIHRQFYAKALDQLHASRLRQSELDRNDKDNLQALRQTLDELRAIHQIERQLAGARP